jgi:hypothetical protein
MRLTALMYASRLPTAAGCSASDPLDPNGTSAFMEAVVIGGKAPYVSRLALDVEEC